MPYTLHLNVGYPDNHTDWVHFQTETGEQWREQRHLNFGPFDTLPERFDRLVALAERTLAEAWVQEVLFD